MVKVTRITDLTGIEVEHLISSTTEKPLVKIRALSENVVLFGEVDPAAARRIANHLMEAAARSEYEADFLSEMRVAEFTDDVLGLMLGMVRNGEMRRMTDLGKGDDDNKRRNQ